MKEVIYMLLIQLMENKTWCWIMLIFLSLVYAVYHLEEVGTAIEFIIEFTKMIVKRSTNKIRVLSK